MATERTGEKTVTQPWGEPGVRYRPIPSEPGYWAGEDGSVWSLKGKTPIRRKPGVAGKDGNRLLICFHRPLRNPQSRQLPYLILEAFIGPKPDGMECCHNDGNPLNNKLSNIRWDTKSENQRDNVPRVPRAF